MQNAIRKLFAPPLFPEDEDKTRSAAILNVVGWSAIFGLTTLLIIRIIQGRDINLVQVNLALLFLIIASGLQQFHHPRFRH